MSKNTDLARSYNLKAPIASPVFTDNVTVNAGNLLVGTSTDNGTDRLQVNGGVYIEATPPGGGDGVVRAFSKGEDNTCSFAAIKESSTTSSDARFIQFYANGWGIPMGGIVGNGTSNVQFASLSDISLKENIKDCEGSLEKINKLRPVSFNWISNGEKVKCGLIAQEVEQVFPEFIVNNMSSNGDAKKGITGGLSSGIVVHLVKAIQELLAKVKELESK